jgi:hypothetical protein
VASRLLLRLKARAFMSLSCAATAAMVDRDTGPACRNSHTVHTNGISARTVHTNDESQRQIGVREAPMGYTSEQCTCTRHNVH